MSGRKGIAMRRTGLGFLAGAVGPALGAAWMYWHEAAHRATLPVSRDTAYCGMGMLAVLTLLFVLAPLCGACGALLAEVSRRR